MHEPTSPAATPRPCSTPHSSPLDWLRYDAESEGEPSPPDAEPAASTDDEFAPGVTAYRRDGWTPFSRKLFLEVLSETGRVTTACEYAQLTKQSAYALRARDALFAASWDAACELARAPLADALYERAIDGVTETIRKDGEVVAERHRHDNRLSIAVLHRLDKRCDRAAESGSHHLALVRHWDEWLTLVGKGEEQAAKALLGPQATAGQSASHGQFGQLPLGPSPTGEIEEEDEIDLSHRFRETWRDGEKVWMTDFPPPADFTGYQSCDYGEPDETYERQCTPEESALLEADARRAVDDERAEQEKLRDEWFALLKEEQAPQPAPQPAPKPARKTRA